MARIKEKRFKDLSHAEIEKLVAEAEKSMGISLAKALATPIYRRMDYQDLSKRMFTIERLGPEYNEIQADDYRTSNWIEEEN